MKKIIERIIIPSSGQQNRGINDLIKKGGLYLFCILLCIVSVFPENDKAPEIQVIQEIPERDFTFQPIDGFGFGTDFLKLLGLDLNVNLSGYKQLLGNNYTFFTAGVDVLPLGGGYWPYNAQGMKLSPDAVMTDPHTSYKQYAMKWDFTLYQGLYYDINQPIAQYINVLNLYSGYTGYFTHSYKDSNTDAYFFKSQLEERDSWLAHVLKTGIMYNDIKLNRLINVKKGLGAQIQAEWAPKFLGNDAVGLTDFTRLSAAANINIPLVSLRDFSLYLYERAGMDILWGSYVPAAASYGLAALPHTIGYGSVRGSILWDAPMHAVHTLEIRGSFPTLFEPGLMPGFNIFWDLGLYSNESYSFAADKAVNSLGLCFVLHMDSASIIPNIAAILDLQAGFVYSFQTNNGTFYFGMSLPQ